MIDTLKELRMWHWRMAMIYRERERKATQAANKTLDGTYAKRMRNTAYLKNNEANFHIRACQLLNDVLPGTAERDCEEDEAKIVNETIEVEGVKWLVVEASSKADALCAIEFARVRGSTGTTYSEERNGVKVFYAEVTRNGAES